MTPNLSRSVVLYGEQQKLANGKNKQKAWLITGATLLDPLLLSKTDSAINTSSHLSTTELPFKLKQPA